MKNVLNVFLTLFVAGLFAACLSFAACGDDNTGTDGGVKADTGGTATGDCATLKACCDKITTAMKTSCQAVVDTGNAQGCQVNLATFKMYCP